MHAWKRASVEDALVFPLGELPESPPVQSIGANLGRGEHKYVAHEICDAPVSG